MRDTTQPSCGHSESGFKIITRHYGGKGQYWKRCQFCGKMGSEEIQRASGASLSLRYLDIVGPLPRSKASSLRAVVVAEREARRAAGACVACGMTTCRGSDGNPCSARREVLDDLPDKWV